MPSADTLIAFLGVSILLGLTPGPTTFCAAAVGPARLARRHGRGGGAVLRAGGAHGAVALGLAAVFAASAVAFTVLKLLGAGLPGVPGVAGPARAPVSSAGPDAGARAHMASAPSLWRMVGPWHGDEPEQPKVLVFFWPSCPSLLTLRRCHGRPAHGAGFGVHRGHLCWCLGPSACFSGVFGSLLLRSPRAAVAQPGGWGWCSWGWPFGWPHRSADGLFCYEKELLPLFPIAPGAVFSCNKRTAPFHHDRTHPHPPRRNRLEPRAALSGQVDVPLNATWAWRAGPPRGAASLLAERFGVEHLVCSDAAHAADSRA